MLCVTFRDSIQMKATDFYQTFIRLLLLLWVRELWIYDYTFKISLYNIVTLVYISGC